MPNTAIPKGSHPRLFRDDTTFEASNLFPAKTQFFCDGSNEILDVDSRASYEEPEIIATLLASVKSRSSEKR
jgi:hypothetical protein